MKIIEGIQMLEEPYKSQALAIIGENPPAFEHPNKEEEDQVNAPSEALALAICWHDSPQGDEYWRDFYFSLKEKEQNDCKTEGAESDQQV
jgi:hypothetical protein